MIDISHLTPEDYKAIEQWIFNSESIPANQFLRLTRINIKYPKSIKVYRGFRINSPLMIDSLFSNKKFKLKLRSQLVSWSKSNKIAEFFSRPTSTKPIGIVIKTILKPNEIILDLTNVNLLRELNRYLPIETSSDLNFEQEVIAKFNPNRIYNLCDNIIKLQIRPRKLSDSNIEKINKLLLNQQIEGKHWTSYQQTDFSCKNGKLI